MNKKTTNIAKETKRLLAEMEKETGVTGDKIKQVVKGAAASAVPYIGKASILTSRIGKTLALRGAKGLLEELTKPAGKDGEESLGQKIGKVAGKILGGGVHKAYDSAAKYFFDLKNNPETKISGRTENLVTAMQNAFSEYMNLEGNFEAGDKQGKIAYAVKKESEKITLYAKDDGLEVTLVHYFGGKFPERELELLSADLKSKVDSLRKDLKNYSLEETINTEQGINGFLSPKYYSKIETSESGMKAVYKPQSRKLEKLEENLENNDENYANAAKGRFVLMLNYTIQMKGGQN